MSWHFLSTIDMPIIYLPTFLLIACYCILILSPFSNLRRLVHAMILKRPPREWIGTFRLVILFFLLFLHQLVLYFIGGNEVL